MVSRNSKLTRRKGSDGLQLPDEVERCISDLGGYEHLSEEIPTLSDLAAVARYHHALSDPTRLRILWALAAADLCPCILKRITKVADSKLTYHLHVLEKARLIRSHRSKNWRVYALTRAGSAALKEG